MTRTKMADKRPDATLDDGWKKQFVASEPRLSEAVQMYEEAGFEVMLKPLPVNPECVVRPGNENEGGDGCRACFEGSEYKYKIVYTRLRKGRKERTGDQ